VISNEAQHVLIVRAGRLEHANEFENAFRICNGKRGPSRTANPPYFGEQKTECTKIAFPLRDLPGNSLKTGANLFRL
jgi:hypothetical protein